LQHGCTQDVDVFVVGRVHFHGDRDQVGFFETKAVDALDTRKAALAPGVGYGGLADGL
jgi:hypothetical protein